VNPLFTLAESIIAGVESRMPDRDRMGSIGPESDYDRRMGPDQPEIRTEHVYPPIPERAMDWRAVFDDYEPGEPQGWGATEQEAIDDLMAQSS
jgi:hypothetical protein